MDGGIVFREVVLIHTIWISVPSRYLPDNIKQCQSIILIMGQNN